jgi:hypothetical protein
VIRIAVSACGSYPAALRRTNVSLAESPASTRRRVRSVATKVQLPELEDARTDTLTMEILPVDYLLL